MKTTVVAFPPPYVSDEQEKQIAQDYAVVYCQHIELFSYFPVDTAMHPVLKNLGITDKVISFIMESVNSNKVKTNLLWYRDNGCALNKCLESQIKSTLYLINACACAHASTWVARGRGGNPLKRAWRKDEMACINSVRQALVSSDFCPLVTAICWSFSGFESEAANGWLSSVSVFMEVEEQGHREWLVSAPVTSVCRRHVCRLCSSRPSCRLQPVRSLNLGLAYVKWR